MKLFILTDSAGNPIADKTAAAVTSMTDTTPVADLGNLVLGDSEPLDILFTNGTSAPSFASDSGYTVTASLGGVSPDGTLNYTSTSAFSIVATSTRRGRLALTTQTLIDAVESLGGNGCCGTGTGAPLGGNLVLQIRVTDPSGYATTHALVQVHIEWRVVAADSTDVVSAAFPLRAVHPYPEIQSLTGGGVTALDGLDDTLLPTGYTVLLSYTYVGQTWQIFAGTDATDPALGIVRVSTYSGTNQRVWRLL